MLGDSKPNTHVLPWARKSENERSLRVAKLQSESSRVARLVRPKRLSQSSPAQERAEAMRPA